EDGIRDFHVTGVQTCALPISDAVRVRLITGMLERGLGDRVVLSMDVTRRSHLKANGGYGYSYLFERLVPALRAAGVSEAELEQKIGRASCRVRGGNRRGGVSG